MNRSYFLLLILVFLIVPLTSQAKCPKCTELKTCEAAAKALETGCKDLDKDGDGIPCESLCGKTKEEYTKKKSLEKK